MKLAELHKVYKKNLYIEDIDRIDVVLAVVISRKGKDKIPLWLFIVGPSGDHKTEQIKALINPKNTYLLTQITENTFVSGRGRGENDLAPKLDGKTILTPDMASLLHIHPKSKALIWAQMRDLYDGIAGKDTGMGPRDKYTNLFINWIGGSTPAIDNQILIHQTLGTRELIYRTKKIDNKSKLAEYITKNIKRKKEMRSDLKNVTSKFLNDIKFRDINISKSEHNIIRLLACYVCYMRAQGQFDEIGELLGDISVELPTRILEQFLKLFICLRNLDKDYSSDRALKILRYVMVSSVIPNRVKIMDFYFSNKDKEFSINSLSEILKVGRRIVYRELNALWNMGLLNRKTMTSFNREYYFFSLNRNHSFIKEYEKFFNHIHLSPDEKVIKNERRLRNKNGSIRTKEIRE